MGFCHSKVPAAPHNGSIQCQSLDCVGVHSFDGEERFFDCEVCKRRNCLKCEAIHEDLDCEQYKEELRIKAGNNTADGTNQKNTAQEFVMAGPAKGIAESLSRLSIKDTSEDQSTTSNVFQMYVKPYRTIEEIKANVALEFEIHSSEMRIFESGEQLDNDKTLSDYTILSGTTLQMSPRDMHIFIEHQIRETKIVSKKKVHLFDTIENVKMKIQVTGGIPAPLQCLRYNGHYLKDEKTVSDYGFKNGSTLQLVSEIRIFVSFRGRKISLSVDPSDTIEAVKSQIKVDQGIPVTADVCVHMNDQYLDDARTVADCDIREQSVLQSSYIMAIFVVSLTATSTLYACPLDTVLDLKMNYQRECGPPSDQQRLFFKGKLLEDLTLAELGITRESKVHLLLRLRGGGGGLSVETLTGKSLHLNVDCVSDTIEGVKMAIQDEEGIPSDRQVLVHGGLELGNRRRLLDLPYTGIQLILIPLRREIFVKTSPSKTIVIELKHTDTTENLKRKLEEREGIPPDRQRLVHAGKKLKVGRKISGYDVPNGATVELLKNTSINIQNWSGKKRTLDAVLEVDTARDVKSMIHERDRLVVEQQVLRFRGEELEDGDTLSKYKIQELSTLELDMEDIVIFIRRVGDVPGSEIKSDDAEHPEYVTATSIVGSPADGHNNTDLFIEAVINKEGGTLEIPNTGVKLDNPKDAVLQRFTIRMKVIGSRLVNPQPPSFSSNSTTVVELLSEGFTGFRRPAKLTLPHCLHLRRGFRQQENQVTVYDSHHDAETQPKWKENPRTGYLLGESDCTLLISDFSWKTYKVNDDIIEAKDITLYAAKQAPETPNPMSLLIDVGYYPGQLGSISKNITLNALTVLRQKVFKVYKEEEKPLTIAFEKSTPEGTWVSKTDEEVISFADLAVNEEDSMTFELERPKGTTVELPPEEKCHFKVSQETANNVRKADLIFYIRQAQLAIQQRTEREPSVSEGNIQGCHGVTTVVSNRQLSKLSTFITDEWKFVGRNLGLEEAVLDEIFRDYVTTDGVREASYQMLRRWKVSTGSGGTVQKLADALGESGLRDLQEKVLRHEYDT